MVSLAQYVVVGLEIGSYIAISAIGFTLIYGLANMINFAHAEFMVFGAYVGYLSAQTFNLPLPITFLLVLVASGIFGWVIARLFYEPIFESGAIPLLITSIAVGFILRYGIQMFTGASPRFFSPPSSSYTLDVLGGVNLNDQSLIVMGTALAVFIVLHLILTKTKVGIALRAMGAEEDLAYISGINVGFMRNYVWILSGALAGLSGYLYGVTLNVTPRLGVNNIILVITAAILGGAGSVYGAIIGAYVLGLAITISTGYLLPGWASDLGTTVAFLVLIGVLFLRPGGITGAEVTATREKA